MRMVFNLLASDGFHLSHGNQFRDPLTRLKARELVP